MTVDWTVQVLTSPAADDWTAVARGLSAVLHAVQQALGPDQDVRWHHGAEPVTGDLHTLVLARRERHDDGDLVHHGASVGDVRARRADGTWPVGVSWELGGPRPGSLRARFDGEVAGPLSGQSPAWLATLLCAVAEVVDADAGQITTRALARALGRRDASLAVGALTLLPDGLPPDMALPAGVEVRPAPSGYPDGCVLVADLDEVAARPDTVADDLLGIDRQLVRTPRRASR